MLYELPLGGLCLVFDKHQEKEKMLVKMFFHVMESGGKLLKDFSCNSHQIECCYLTMFVPSTSVVVWMLFLPFFFSLKLA